MSGPRSLDRMIVWDITPEQMVEKRKRASSGFRRATKNRALAAKYGQISGFKNYKKKGEKVVVS